MRKTLNIEWFNDASGEKKLDEILNEIKFSGKDRQYDCIIGLSGGVDSSYLALKAYDWGLRPLIIHVDGGWNSELAVRNIEKILNYTGWSLQTKVINWPEMMDLQIAYLRSGVCNQDVPQDHAFFASLFKCAADYNIKFILSGGNIATEGIFPKSWHGPAMDAINLRAIHKRYGNRKLKDYPTISFYDYYLHYPFIKGIRQIRLLNFVRYNKIEASVELEERIGYVRYARKHGESNFTRFFQEFYLVHKFQIDKRLPHLSSQIVSGQITRQEALNSVQQTLFDEDEINRLKDHIARKLRLGSVDFEALINSPIHDWTEFKNWTLRYKMMKFIQEFASRFLNTKLHRYR